ncbi:EF-hand calcium-binding domain-containing protein 6, partial [Exaiptasia diaphana]
RAMKKHDYNDDGMISIDDFKSNLKEFGFHVSDEDFFHILSEFDVSMNGRISYVAFMKQAVL